MPKDEDKLEESPPPPPPAASSDSSSPCHEFSFTISSSSAEPPPVDDTTKSPADDIFFHGHLLPLQLLSHLPPPPPLSPRSSTSNSSSKHFSGFQISNTTDHPQEQKQSSSTAKLKPSPVFWPLKFRKIFQVKDKQDHDDQNPKNKSTFDVKISHVLKKYMKMVRPILSSFTKSSRRRRTNSMQVHKQTHSFSAFRDYKEMKRGRGVMMQQRSAPASMRTSPTNSGPLLPNVGIPSYTSDSTMEELQAAIQAAIAHCKNSFAVEDNKKSHVVD